ncbi:Arm DNA-binding domain-containing protein [Xanthobacter aminoxidans]|uniref:Arm DNA-binding domain-containing protein n=1 Tax=Xanthobacter aminoxidans TaxID=186280 RepID=A0ABW6ZLR0_9HYPH
MPLTDTAIRAAKAGDKPYKLADGGGLYLLVNPTGSRLWRLKCRIEGKEKLLAIGPYLELSISPRRGSGATTSTAIIDGGVLRPREAVMGGCDSGAVPATLKLAVAHIWGSPL